MRAVAEASSRRSRAKTPPAPPLERIDWPVMFAVKAYGVRIGVRVNDVQLAEDAMNYLPPDGTPLEFSETGRMYSLVVDESDPSGTPQHAVYLNGALLARRATTQALLRAFEADVQLYVAEMAPNRVFVHAGVVGYRGRAIVLPGRSFTGKTTLVAELVRAGAEYYSDEYAVLDSDGVVYPYARRLSIRQPGGAGVSKCTVETLGGHAGRDAIPVGLVVVTKFRTDGEWYPQRLSPGRGVQALFANTVPARRIPEAVLDTLHQVVVEAPVIATDRGEASNAVKPILDLAVHGVDSVPTP
jgi:hypothetical protein